MNIFYLLYRFSVSKWYLYDGKLKERYFYIFYDFQSNNISKTRVYASYCCYMLEMLKESVMYHLGNKEEINLFKLHSCLPAKKEQKSTFENCNKWTPEIFCAHLKLRPYCSFEIFCCGYILWAKGNFMSLYFKRSFFVLLIVLLILWTTFTHLIEATKPRER